MGDRRHFWCILAACLLVVAGCASSADASSTTTVPTQNCATSATSTSASAPGANSSTGISVTPRDGVHATESQLSEIADMLGARLDALCITDRTMTRHGQRIDIVIDDLAGYPVIGGLSGVAATTGNVSIARVQSATDAKADGGNTTQHDDQLFVNIGGPSKDCAAAPVGGPAVMPAAVGGACYQVSSVVKAGVKVASAVAKDSGNGNWSVQATFASPPPALVDAVDECAEHTAACPDGNLAVILDGKVVGVATVGKGAGSHHPLRITAPGESSYGPHDAAELAAVLAAGPMPMKVSSVSGWQRK